MDKLIDKVGIRNYRSFDSEGVYLDQLNKVNLFIGKNNSGKSNVLKFLKFLSVHRKLLNKAQLQVQDTHLGSTTKPSVFVRYPHDELGFPLNISPTHSSYSHHFRKELKEVLVKPVEIEQVFGEAELIMNFGLSDGYNSSSSKKNIFKQILDHLKITDVREDFEHRLKRFLKEEHWHRKLLTRLENVIYIPDFRIIDQGYSHKDIISDITGENIIKEVFKMQNPDIHDGEKKQTFHAIEQIIGEMIGEKVALETLYPRQDDFNHK